MALDSYSDDTRSALREAQKSSRAAVRAWKNEWWQARLTRLEQAALAKDSAKMFGEAQQMTRLLRSNGLSSSVIFESPAAATTARAHHFQNVLNVNRTFADDVWDELPDLSHAAATVDWSAPSWHEILSTIQQLNTGKAPDILGVHAELIKALYRVRSSESGRQAVTELHIDAQPVDHCIDPCYLSSIKGRAHMKTLMITGVWFCWTFAVNFVVN